jgi:glucose/arabinose dehydrogenase
LIVSRSIDHRKDLSLGNAVRRPTAPRGWCGRSRFALVVAVGIAVLGACASADDTPSTGGSAAPVGAEPREVDLTTELTRERGGELMTATVIAQLPATLTAFASTSSGEELLVSDRRGLVWRLQRTETDGYIVPKLDPEPVLDVSERVSLLGERGFMGMMLVDEDESLVVNYTALDGAITVHQYPYRPGQAIDPDSGRTLLELDHPYAWHHGGDMDVDAAGNLYVGIGDMEFRQLDPPGPQDPDLFLGGIMRVPAEVLDDPSAEWEATPDHMVAKGLRNPWRINIDSRTGDLWIGDVGLDTREEVNVIPADELGDGITNFGWPYFEGTLPHQGTPPEDGDFIFPVLEREQGDSVCGMVGGFVYRGERIPDLQGRFVYGDLCGPEARSFAVGSDGSASDDRAIVSLPETVVSFGEDHLGELYGLGATGSLFRLDPVGWTPGDLGQEPADPGPTTTVVPRSIETCDGMVGAVLPLSELGSLSPGELERILPQVNRDVAAVIPELPDFLLEDALIVQAAIVELTRALEQAGWDPTRPEAQAARDQILQGDGIFAGFPEAMARIVDAECG